MGGLRGREKRSLPAGISRLFWFIWGNDDLSSRVLSSCDFCEDDVVLQRACLNAPQAITCPVACAQSLPLRNGARFTTSQWILWLLFSCLIGYLHTFAERVNANKVQSFSSFQPLNFNPSLNSVNRMRIREHVGVNPRETKDGQILQISENSKNHEGQTTCRSIPAWKLGVYSAIRVPQKMDGTDSFEVWFREIATVRSRRVTKEGRKSDGMA